MESYVGITGDTWGAYTVVYINLLIPANAIFIELRIDSGNSLVPKATKPLPEPILTYHQLSPVGGQFHRMCSKISIIKMCLKIELWKIQAHFSGASELKEVQWGQQWIEAEGWVVRGERMNVKGWTQLVVCERRAQVVGVTRV